MSVPIMSRLQLWLETRPQSFLESLDFLSVLGRSYALVKPMQSGFNLSGHPALR